MNARRASELVPSGFIVENVAMEAERVVVSVRAAAGSCPCPLCGAVTRRVHSRYLRRLADLPVGGRRAELVLRARRLFCDASPWARGVFSQRRGEDSFCARGPNLHEVFVNDHET